MARIIILILALCCCFSMKADQPGPAYQYDRYSENSKFYFKSIPYYNYDETNFGKTIIYNSQNDKELYSIDNYLHSETFISNTGKSLATINYWMWGNYNFEDQTIINIYINGIDSIQYRIDDLVSDKSKLQKTSSHTLWYKNIFVKNDTLFVLTLENKAVLIDLSTGEIISKKKISNCKSCSKSNSLIRPITKYYHEIKYPEGYIFPDLINGKSFRQSLIEGIEKAEVKEYKDCEYYIMVYGTIDRKGNCEIFLIETSVNKKDDKKWEKKVSDWVKAQKYQTDIIPKNCDKWVFREYFYLR